MPEQIYVIGHKNPDTDSICAAIAYARLKTKLGIEHVNPYRAGKINRETEFVLDFFGVEAPPYLADLSLRVRDLLNGEVLTATKGTSLHQAWLFMKGKKQKTLPVVDNNRRMLGMLTVGDLSEAYMESMGDVDFGALHVPVKNVVNTLAGQMLVGDELQELRGHVRVAAMHHETMEARIESGNIVMVGNRTEAQETALRVGVSALVLTGGATLSASLLAQAREKGIVIISTDYDTFTTARLLPLSVPVESIMKAGEIVSFQEDDLLTEVKHKMLETRYRNYPVLDEQERVVGMISRYHLLSMSKKKVILVDHNEWGQAVMGADQAQVLEVIDHHRVGGIMTGEPILFRNEPVGSTCTLVAEAYGQNNLVPERELAGLMLAAILSDTVLFKSPTCTAKDREMAAYLAGLAEVEVQKFGVEMFKAASSLSERTPLELIEEDLKEFSAGDQRVGVGQVSVMGLEGLAAIRADLSATMEHLVRERGMRYLLLMVTDLLSESTELFIAGDDPAEVAKAFQRPLANGSVFLPGVLSRKKQIVPPLTRHFLG